MARLAFLLLLPVVAMLAGCGGDGASLVLSGDYLPATVGATWQYRLETRVEVGDKTFTGTGSLDREVVRTEPLNLDGTAVTAYVVADNYTFIDTPVGLPLTTAQRQLLDLLFVTASGGTGGGEAYYVTTVAPALPGSIKHTLAALRQDTGSLVNTLTPRAHLYSPPLIGEAHSAAQPFMPLPLLPPAAVLRDQRVATRLQDYDDVTTALGVGHAVYSFEQYAGYVNLPLGPCAFSGHGRSLLLQDAGLAQADWTLTYTLDGQVRVSVRVIGESSTLPENS